MGIMSVREHGGSDGEGSSMNTLDRHDSPIHKGTSKQVSVEIDELVLTGFSRSDGQTIAESLKETLGHLLADDSTTWSGSESVQLEALDAGNIHVHQRGRAQATGARIARALYGRLPR